MLFGTNNRDLSGGGMDLMVIITVDLMIENFLGVLYVSDVFPHTCSNEPILEPPIGSFNFAFCLGRERIGDFYITVIHDLFPLGIGFIGELVMGTPVGVSALHKPKYGMAIDVVGVGGAIFQDNGLKSKDVSPRGFLFQEDGVENESAKVIQGSN